MKPALITGATGYLGAHVLNQAGRRGIAAVGTSGTGGGGTLRCDLRNGTAVASLVRETGAHTVIHCAAIVPKSLAEYDDAQAARDNLAMIDALCAAHPGRVVFMSSMSVYPTDCAMPAREEDEHRPDTAYGRAKREAEQRLLAAVPDAICLRLPGLFGAPRRSGLLYNTAVAFAEGRSPSFDKEFPLWSALHVDDATDLCLRAASQTTRGVLNAGYPGAMSVPRAVASLARHFGRATPPMPGGPSFEMDLSRLAETLGLPRYSFEDRLSELVRSVRRAA